MLCYKNVFLLQKLNSPVYNQGTLYKSVGDFSDRRFAQMKIVAHRGFLSFNGFLS